MNTGNEWWKNPALARFFQQPKENNNAVAQQQDTIGGGKDGFTGNGADNIPQPERRVPGAGNGQYDVHESEFVFNAPSTQAIGADILQGIQTGAEQGTLDVNRLREVIGQPAKPGFQRGGLTPPAQQPSPIPSPIRQRPPTPTIGATADVKKQQIPIPPQTITPIAPQQDIVSPKFPLQPQGIPNIPQPTFPLVPQKLPDIPIEDVKQPGAKKPPVTMKKAGELGAGVYSEEEVKPPVGPAKPVSAPDLLKSAVKPIAADAQMPQLLPATVHQLNQNNISMDDVMDYIKGIMDGSHPYFQMIKDMLMQDIGGAGAAGTAAMKQEARQRGWSDEQIASLGISRQRDVEAIGSQALGQLATEQSKMGMQAAKDLFGMQVTAEQLQMSKDQFDFEQKKYDEQFSFIKQKYGDDEGGRIGEDIALGMTWDQIKKKYPNMTFEDYKSMKDASPLGQQNWQKKMDAINMLLAAGGTENFENAADMLNGMFPGMDIDFSNAITAENAQNFSQGMGNLASYIASGLSWEDAFKAMKEDGTFDLLGMTESDIESMYNKLMLNQNPILQAEETYQQLLDQGVISQEDYDDMMAFLTWGLTHPEGIDISDGYAVFDKDGNEVGFFKTEKEMNDWIAENPGDYNTEKVENHITATGIVPTGPGQGGDDKDPLKPFSDDEWDNKSVSDQWESFKASIPDGEEDKWPYDRWIAEGKWQTFDGWTKNNADNPPDPISFKDRIDKTGWAKKADNLNYDRFRNTLIKEGRELFENNDIPITSFKELIESGAKDLSYMGPANKNGVPSNFSADQVHFFEEIGAPVAFHGLTVPTFDDDGKGTQIFTGVNLDTGQLFELTVKTFTDGSVEDMSYSYTES